MCPYGPSAPGRKRGGDDRLAHRHVWKVLYWSVQSAEGDDTLGGLEPAVRPNVP